MRPWYLVGVQEWGVFFVFVFKIKEFKGKKNFESQAKTKFIQRSQFHYNLKESPQGRQATISAAAQRERSGEKENSQDL